MKFSLPVLIDVSSSQKESAVTRRAFVIASGVGVAGCFLASCGGGDGPTGVSGTRNPPPTGSVSFTGGVVSLNVSLIPGLSAENGPGVVSATDSDKHADIVVINLGGNVYKAFTSVCTHEGCTVSGYSNKRLVCPCHGSEFDQNGQPVAGPAPSALRPFPATFDVATQTLRVTVV